MRKQSVTSYCIQIYLDVSTHSGHYQSDPCQTPWSSEKTGYQLIFSNWVRLKTYTLATIFALVNPPTSTTTSTPTSH